MAAREQTGRPPALLVLGVAAWGAAAAGPALAQADLSGGYGTFGSPGLIDMPSAWMPADGTLALGVSHFAQQTRSTLTFQITPRLSGSFQYSQLYDISPDGTPEGVTDYRFDRSFSLQYRLIEEGGAWPAVVVGLNDFLGTGLYRSEYIVASRDLGDSLRVTAGLGWGRLAGVGGFHNPLAVLSDNLARRDTSRNGFGGEVEIGGAFSGDAALFGGIEWQATDRLRLIAEYSSDAYANEDPYVFDRRSQVNLGLSYALTDHLTLNANYLYGAELGLQLSYAINPAHPPFGQGRADAPLPVHVRSASEAAETWRPQAEPQYRAATAAALDGQGIVLLGLGVMGESARVEVENRDHMIFARALGRVARVLSRTLPGAIETFEIVIVERGIPVSQVTLARSDIEALEFDLDGAWSTQVRAAIEPAAGPLMSLPGLYPRLDYGIAPYLTPSLFDPDDPLRVDLGLDLNARFEPAPGLVLAGTLRQRLVGTLDQASRPSTSGLPRVRSESNLYDAAADTTIPVLTASWYFRAAPEIYGRVTAGYLEPMFGGVSAEVLWLPVESRIALGAELNYAVQRDFDQLFGFRDYDVVTGHLSGYWDMGSGFHAQVDLGRYLAGDWGGTLTLSREFENGWRVGAFATLTDVPFDAFGEGSFDKGLVFTIPVGWASGGATRDTSELTIRPVLRDGGARLDVEGRLYDLLRPGLGAELADGWGSFWR